jgi:hypothetical protein
MADAHKLTLFVVDAPSRIGRTHIQNALRFYGTLLDPTIVKVTDSVKTWKCMLEPVSAGMTEESRGACYKATIYHETFVQLQVVL